MKFELERLKNEKVSEEDFFEDLRRVREIVGGDLTRRDYNKHGKFSSGVAMRRYGGWNKALEAAGLTPSKLIIYSDDDLFLNLEEVWTQLGRQPRVTDLVRPVSKFSIDVYRKRFGSWWNALQQFVDQANLEPPIPSLSSVERHNQLEDGESKLKHLTKRDINWRLRWHVLNRDNFRCMSCGLSPAIAPGTILHVDHIKPWSKGGETVLDNLQTLCATCNLGKGNVE